MSSPDPSAAALDPAVTTLLRQAGQGESRYKLVPLSGGANNQVYRVEFEDRVPLVLKRYYFSPDDRRDRFHAEKSFYDLIMASGMREQTPQALAWDRENRLGLFSWIEGRRLHAAEVTRDAVEQALSFYFAINAHRHLPEASSAPNASEACFDLGQHFECVERRLSRLAGVATDSPTGREVVDFISGRLRPAFEKYKALCAETKLANPAPLEGTQRCLSPSDFGFHNALNQSGDRLAFFDFEYAGWDDPAKFLCDFLCQPAVPIPRPLWSYCIESLCRPLAGGSNRERIALLLPLYHMKWCCILLNEFLPQERNRRAFSQRRSPEEMESRMNEQLGKARNLLESLASVDLTQNSGFDDNLCVAR